MFEDKIIKNCSLKQKHLMRAAKVASKNPETGVVIEKKSAYFVIRDCADITQKYLTLLCYGSYTDPLSDLYGKFTEKEIIDFVARSQDEKNHHIRHLLYVIFTDIARKEGIYEKVVTNEPAPIDITEVGEDIYGDYEYVHEDEDEDEDDIALIDIDITDGKIVIDKLIDVFGADRQTKA
jgi:hypothetical protein